MHFITVSNMTAHFVLCLTYISVFTPNDVSDQFEKVDDRRPAGPFCEARLRTLTNEKMHTHIYIYINAVA
jgi:hypothetical protein